MVRVMKDKIEDASIILRVVASILDYMTYTRYCVRDEEFCLEFPSKQIFFVIVQMSYPMLESE